MSPKRFSSLHTVLFLAAFVVFWLVWTNTRLRDSTASLSSTGTKPGHGQGPGQRSRGRQGSSSEPLKGNENIQDSNPEGYKNGGRPDPELDLSFLLKQKSSPLETLAMNFTIVTAASANHFCALESFLYSMSELMEGLERTEKRPTIVVYNLGGMDRKQKAHLAYLKDNLYIDEYKDFNYTAYPAFWDINVARGEYGWKAGMIKEVADKYRGLVLWLDSGNMLALDFLRYLPGYLDKFGFWSPQSSGSFQQYTHEGLPQYFGDTMDNYAQETNCNGAAVAFDTSKDRVYKGLLQQWYDCSRVKDCIAPKGSSRSNHRQDQAALTYLVKRLRFMDQCRHYPEHYGVTVHQDKVCKERIRAFKIMKGLGQENDEANFAGDEDDEDS